MTALQIVLWVAVPYAAIAVFIVGHIWRYRYDKFGWTTRSSQTYENRLLRWGSPMFHIGILMVIAGHVVGLLIPREWLYASGITEEIYHLGATGLGSFAAALTLAGLAILIYRRRTVGPVFAQSIGLGVEEIALFMSLGIAGGAVAQYPIGWLSDRIGRRVVLIGATAGAAGASLLLASSSAGTVFAAIALFGGFSLPLYSLSVAHANDIAEPSQFLEVAGGLALFYALGATLGPLAVATLIEHLGAPSFFVYTAILHTCFIAFVVYRMRQRAEVPRPKRRRFIGLLRTSTQLYRRAPDEEP